MIPKFPELHQNMLKQTVTTVSDHIFAGIGYSFNNKAELQTRSPHNEITSNFPLQMAIFFNIVFFPVWITTIFVMLPLKYERLPDLNKIILIIALTAVISIEIIRLYMGYMGNLTENIPGLAGFWMLSLLLQTPLQLFLLHSALLPTVVERVTQLIMCVMLFAQLICGFFALHTVAKHSSAKFHVSQFVDTYR